MSEQTRPGASSQADTVELEPRFSNRPVLVSQALLDESAESLRKMPPVHRVETPDLHALFVESFGALAAQVEASIRWFGTAVETIAPAGAILAASTDAVGGIDEDAVQDSLAFYNGKQWPADIEAMRQRDARPCLVVNQLPALVAAALAKQEATGQRVLSDAAIETLMVILVIQNRDAQRLYNYVLSALAEQLAASSPRPEIRTDVETPLDVA